MANAKGKQQLDLLMKRCTVAATEDHDMHDVLVILTGPEVVLVGIYTNNEPQMLILLVCSR